MPNAHSDYTFNQISVNVRNELEVVREYSSQRDIIWDLLS